MTKVKYLQICKKKILIMQLQRNSKLNFVHLNPSLLVRDDHRMTLYGKAFGVGW